VLASLHPPPLAERRQQVSPPLHRGEKQEEGTTENGVEEEEKEEDGEPTREKKGQKNCDDPGGCYGNSKRRAMELSRLSQFTSRPAAARNFLASMPATPTRMMHRASNRHRRKCELYIRRLGLAEIYASLAACRLAVRVLSR